MDMELESKTHICRLCLREYTITEMLDIFAKEHELDQTIYEAVSIRIARSDVITVLCNNCLNVIQIINSFKEACRKSNDILKHGGPITLESNAWSNLNDSNVFHQTAELIETHQQDVDIMYRNYKSLKRSECAALESDYIVELIKQEDHTGDDEVDQDKTDDFDVSTPSPETTTVIQDLDNKRTKEESASDGETSSRRGRKNPENRKDKVVCPTCGELVSQQGLEGHLNRHLGVQPFPCDVEGCEAKLFSKFALQQHRSRHKSSNRYFDCKVCGKRIKGSAYWLLHKKIHEEEPRFGCDICGKKFRRKCKLKVHSTVHSGIAEYPCEICGKFFTVKHNLTAHYKLHVKNGTCPAGFEPQASRDVNT
ncbi:zinc finger protein 681 [Aedes albopictus]|uniref:C2h2-type zn-finger protein n=1 Tax=Aedes albopictus TaxID=7160 RepID=A0ABM1YZ91_AEDAL|nr:zinc finger protein 681-like [Aedes albopictus]